MISLLRRGVPWLALCLAAIAQPHVAVRFHHVHLVVDDPAPAMKALAARAEGTRVILSGLGVGVRRDAQYVLFDRAADGVEIDRRAASSDAAGRYARAAAWLRARGVQVDPDEWSSTAFGRHVAAGSIDHVAFAADSIDRVADRLRAAGASPERRGADAMTVAIGDGETVEIVRDTDRPDAFWCPMHLDVRSPAAGECPVCGMGLVPIPPLRVGEYRLDVELRGSRRVTGLRLRVRDPDGQAAAAFATVHERLLHLFVISRDLRYFAHVHPERAAADGSFELKHDLPPGAYVLLADFVPYGGVPQMLHRAIVTPGARAAFQDPPSLAAGPASVVVDGVRVQLDAELVPRNEGTLRFAFADATTGAPVSDLEPYLGAAAHLLIVKPDLTDAIHVHPAERAPAPAIAFEPLIPAPGLYKLWLQFQRKGRVSTASFVVDVK